MRKRLKKKLLAKRLEKMSLIPVPVDDMRSLDNFILKFMQNAFRAPEIFEESSERPRDFV